VSETTAATLTLCTIDSSTRAHVVARQPQGATPESCERLRHRGGNPTGRDRRRFAPDEQQPSEWALGASSPVWRALLVKDVIDYEIERLRAIGAQADAEAQHRAASAEDLATVVRRELIGRVATSHTSKSPSRTARRKHK